MKASVLHPDETDAREQVGNQHFSGPKRSKVKTRFHYSRFNGPVFASTVLKGKDIFSSFSKQIASVTERFLSEHQTNGASLIQTALMFRA